MRPILVLNGPNLNLLGQRQPEVYGRDTLLDVERSCRALAAELGHPHDFRQSNHEGVLIDWIQEARGATAGIVLNPGSYGHTSIGILDALNAYEGPVVEVHVSQVHRREAFRHHSFVSLRADAVIAGAGPEGYLFGLRRVATLARA